jgi:rRNA maturation protein Nop10
MPSKITRKDIAELLKIPAEGKFFINTDKPPPFTKYRNAIKENLYEVQTQLGKTSGLHKNVKLLHKILISTIIPRVGGSDQLSWDQRHMLLFLLKGTQMNLPAYLFHYLCSYVNNTTEQGKTWVAFPRLLSELFYQCRLNEKLKEYGAPELLIEKRSPFLTTESICNILKIPKSELVYPNNPLKEDLQTRALRDDIIPVYKNEPPEVIANYMRKEGKFISYSDLESEPEDEYSKKRRRVTKSVKFEAVPEGQEVKKVKKEPQKKSSTAAGGSKVQNKPVQKVSQKPECIVAEVHDDSDAEVDMPLLKRSKVKHSTQKISSDSEQGLRFWMLFMSCWTVIWKNWSIIRRVLRLGWIR